MPNIFKTLASIMVWILFIISLLIIVRSFVFGTISGQLFTPNVVPDMFYPIAILIAIVAGFLSVCAMVLRKKLD